MDKIDPKEATFIHFLTGAIICNPEKVSEILDRALELCDHDNETLVAAITIVKDMKSVTKETLLESDNLLVRHMGTCWR